MPDNQDVLPLDFNSYVQRGLDEIFAAADEVGKNDNISLGVFVILRWLLNPRDDKEVSPRPHATFRR